MYKFGPADFYLFENGDSRNWVLPNGLGGYSSQSIINSSYRKHHGYLVASLKAPVKRCLILTRINELIQTKNEWIDLESQRFKESKKEGYRYLEEFSFENIPSYRYKVGGLVFEKKISPMYGYNTVAISYDIKNGSDAANFILSPLLNCRDHGEASSPDDLKFREIYRENCVEIYSKTNRNLLIKMFHSGGKIDRSKEKDRILGPYHCEYDIATGDNRYDYHYNPFLIKFQLEPLEELQISIVVTIENNCTKNAFEIIQDYEDRMNRLIKKSRIKDPFGRDLVRSADVFICKRKSTKLKTILAGLPWFTDWGRDTMIAFTGLTLVTKRFKEAREVLESFSLYERRGLIPNMFPDSDQEPLYNTVDASLWYFYAVYKFIEYTKDYDFIYRKIFPVLENIIQAYSTNTDFSIYMDEDFLVSSGSNLDQVTWMDVRYKNIVVTPRHGKAVEINALWYNALCIMTELCEHSNRDGSKYEKLAQKVKKSFNKRFYCEKTKCLYDVVDPDDESIRPNQIWALSLPFKVLDEDKAESVLKVVYEDLFNHYGLRSLSYRDSRFKAKYEGDLENRDFAYHMGTTWGFLIGGFFDAYTYVHHYSDEAIEQVKKWILSFENHLKEGCINGIAEIFDGDYPNKTKGCYTQAWSVGEVLRAYYENVLSKK